MTRTRILLTSTALLWATSASADFTFTQGTGATGFSFTAATGGTSLCAASVTHCFASVPINTAGAALAMNAGAASAATLRSITASDSPEIALLTSIKADVESAIPACSASPCTTVIGAVVPYQGTAALSATNGGFQNILQGNVALSATNPIFIAAVPPTTGGASSTSVISANNATGVNLKASAGQLYGFEVYSISATPAYLKLYNSASAPTCGSGTPVRRILIPASTTGAGAIRTIDVGVAFSSGIGYCLVTGIADNDATAPAANVYLANIDWK